MNSLPLNRSTALAAFVCATVLLVVIAGRTCLADPLSTAFRFQGRLRENAIPTSGTYDFRLRLYDSEQAGQQIGSTAIAAPVAVKDGLFTLAGDFGAAAFLGAPLWLEVSVRTNGSLADYVVLSSRHQLRPTPHAAYALTTGGVAANGNLGLVGDVRFSRPNGAPFSVNSSSKVDQLTADLLDGVDSSQLWRVAGNPATVPGTDFLGTTDDQRLELRVNNNRCLALLPTSPTPSLLAGSSANDLGGAAVGSVIAGGGSATAPNLVLASYASVSGGRGNLVSERADCAAIGGGLDLQVQRDASYAVIRGGWQNSLATNGFKSVIGGGSGNSVGLNSSAAVIAGGWLNTVGTDARNNTISGGARNSIGTQMLQSRIGGGFNNFIAGPLRGGVIAGGGGNLIETNVEHAVIFGGQGNLIRSASANTVILGGEDNFIEQNASQSVIFGGQVNRVGTNSAVSVISGGGANVIGTSASHATIAGGYGNTIDFDADYTLVAGGRGNSIGPSADYSIIDGGYSNSFASSASYCAIRGGMGNKVGENTTGAIIGGGASHSLSTNTDYAVIGGGNLNLIEANAGRTTIAGGAGHIIGSAADYGTIPGGRYAQANLYGQLAYASGRFAATGDAQASFYVLNGVTSGAATNALALDGWAEWLTIPSGATWAFKALVVGLSANGNSASFELRGYIKRDAGGVDGMGSQLVLGRDLEAWSAQAMLSSSYNALVIVVSGSAGETVNWVARLATAEVSY